MMGANMGAPAEGSLKQNTYLARQEQLKKDHNVWENGLRLY